MEEDKKDTFKELAKEAYNDIGKPIAKPLGKTLGLIPRAIKAALLPLEKWILEREYNLAETEKLLAEKLKNIPPEQITTPDAYVAVPALQYISYCMDNNELRDMYANLLANSMNKVVKNGVHPSFAEIIKQLSPDEAKILKYISLRRFVATITLRYENDLAQGVDVVRNFSNIGELTGCEYPLKIGAYFDNLMRLGLLFQPYGQYITIPRMYEILKEHQFIETKIAELKYNPNYTKTKIAEGMMEITSYGKQFCDICIGKFGQ